LAHNHVAFVAIFSMSTK